MIYLCLRPKQYQVWTEWRIENFSKGVDVVKCLVYYNFILAPNICFGVNNGKYFNII